MKKDYKTIISFNRRDYSTSKPQSKRPHRFLLEQAIKLRKKVLYLSLTVIFLLLIYILFFSSIFTINNIIINVDEQVNYEEARNYIDNILSTRFLSIIPYSNYFFANKYYINKRFQEKYPINQLKITKRFPKTIIFTVVSSSGQSLWLTNEKVYLINRSGKIIREFLNNDLNNSNLIKIYDLSNTKLNINDNTLDQKVLNLIYQITDNFENYQLPQLLIDCFRVDSPKANYFKLVTKQGFEIHFNILQSLDDQMYKLKQSLNAGKIDLNKIQYINLRIPNQVIYK